MDTVTTVVPATVLQQATHCYASSNDRALSVKVRLAYLITADALLEAATHMEDGEDEDAELQHVIALLRVSAENYREDEAVAGVFLGALDELTSLF